MRLDDPSKHLVLSAVSLVLSVLRNTRCGFDCDDLIEYIMELITLLGEALSKRIVRLIVRIGRVSGRFWGENFGKPQFYWVL